MRRFLGATVWAAMLSTLLSACARPPQYLTAPGSPNQPAVSFDGTYQGSIRITDSAATVPKSWCETDRRLVLQVRSNGFTYVMTHPTVPDLPIPSYAAYIYPDGSIQGQSGDMGVMRGRLTGTHMEGVINGSGCDYAFTADRS
jgi:hypothetical protein